MERRPGMTENQRHMAIGMLVGGWSVRKFARGFNYSVLTNQRLRARHQQTGTVTDLPRSSRPLKMNPREDRYIETCSRRNHLWSCRMIAARLMNATRTRVSVSTVRTRLRSTGSRAHRP